MSRTAQRGLSLIELMVVLVITAILLVAVAPSFTDYLARRRLEGVANELSADLQYARAQAVDNNDLVWVDTKQANSYRITNKDPDKSATEEPTTPVDYKKSPALPPAVTLTRVPAALAKLAFEPERGSLVLPTGVSAPVHINVQSTQLAAALRVSVHSTGRISICSPEGKFSGYPQCSN